MTRSIRGPTRPDADTPPIVFDQRGTEWSASSPALQSALASSISGRTLVDYTVVNIGFVSAIHVGNSIAVYLRPKVASATAIAAFLFWLHSRTVDRVLMCSFHDLSWSYVLLNSRSAAIEYLATLLSCDAS